jgi:hypothetical protein
MKIIKCYWENTEFQSGAILYDHCMVPGKHFVEIEVEENATEEEIEDLLKRKDVKRIQKV